MVIPTRFERVTPGLGILCSILLSYGTSRAQTRQNRLANKVLSADGAAGLRAITYPARRS